MYAHTYVLYTRWLCFAPCIAPLKHFVKHYIKILFTLIFGSMEKCKSIQNLMTIRGSLAWIVFAILGEYKCLYQTQNLYIHNNIYAYVL